MSHLEALRGPPVPLPPRGRDQVVVLRGIPWAQYRRLKIPEVWFSAKGRFWLCRIVGRGYRPVAQSHALPALDLAEIARILEATDESHQTEAVRAYRRSLRRRR